ncbi:helix-turn-helix domain-containing protein [Rhizobium sp. Nf11,1]|uniref:helix-turn-helix domain-containing protein n=1 Tax=Rhizobium sp. Nf11,1 TaxID=3404923 RepID=UPI003D327A8E
MPYHYTESGLDNVVLVNGYEVENHPEYGELVSINNIRGLHDAIGLEIVNLTRPLNGAEFRYLRLELDLSQRALATVLGTNEQSIAKWEKARTKAVANKAAERFLRVMYLEHCDAESKVGIMIKRLAELDSHIGDMEMRLEMHGSDWSKAA